MRFSCIPVLPSSAETQVIWGGIVKRRLIAYIIGNISAQNIKMCSRVSKLYQTNGGMFFFRHSVLYVNPRKSFFLKVYRTRG